jgi:hypothetical protein
MLLNNAKINDIIENLNYGLENFELAKIENSIDMISKYHINIDPEMLEKAFEIIDERLKYLIKVKLIQSIVKRNKMNLRNKEKAKKNDNKNI